MRSLLQLPLAEELELRPVRGYSLRSWVGPTPTVALDEHGDVVAFTELRVSRATGSLANTEDTAVVRDHRRRGLGFWVKLESLRRLEEERPDVGLVTTTNAEQSDAILRVNRALGFSPVAVHTTCVLRV